MSTGAYIGRGWRPGSGRSFIKGSVATCTRIIISAARFHADAAHQQNTRLDARSRRQEAVVHHGRRLRDGGGSRVNLTFSLCAAASAREQSPEAKPHGAKRSRCSSPATHRCRTQYALPHDTRAASASLRARACTSPSARAFRLTDAVVFRDTSTLSATTIGLLSASPPPSPPVSPRRLAALRLPSVPIPRPAPAIQGAAVNTASDRPATCVRGKSTATEAYYAHSFGYCTKACREKRARSDPYGAVQSSVNWIGLLINVNILTNKRSSGFRTTG